MLNILSSKINNDVNSIIYDMIKDLSLEEKIKRYPYFLELYENIEDIYTLNQGMDHAARGVIGI